MRSPMPPVLWECLEQPFQQNDPKWFWGITCTIILWLHLEFWRRGSAWFFGPHLFVFGPWGQFLGRVRGNHHTQTPPGYHAIHLGRGEFHNLQFGDHSSTKPCFSNPICCPKNLPRPARAQFPNPGSKFWFRGPKMSPRAPKPKRCAPKNNAEPRLQN